MHPIPVAGPIENDLLCYETLFLGTFEHEGSFIKRLLVVDRLRNFELLWKYEKVLVVGKNAFRQTAGN